MYECKLLEAMARHFNNPLQKDYAHVSNWEEENIFNTSFVQNRLDVNHPTVFYHIGEGGSFSHICILYRGSWQIRYRAFEKYKTAGWDKYSQNGAVPGWRRMLLWIRLQISDWTFRFKMWEPTSTKNWHTHIDLPYYPSNSQLTNLFWIFYNISLNIVIHISIFSINKSPQKKEPDGPDAKVTPCKRHRQAPPYGYEIKTRKNSFIKQTFQFPHSYFASLHSFLLINLLPESKVCFTKFPVPLLSQKWRQEADFIVLLL